MIVLTKTQIALAAGVWNQDSVDWHTSPSTVAVIPTPSLLPSDPIPSDPIRFHSFDQSGWQEGDIKHSFFLSSNVTSIWWQVRLFLFVPSRNHCPMIVSSLSPSFPCPGNVSGILVFLSKAIYRMRLDVATLNNANTFNISLRQTDTHTHILSEGTDRRNRRTLLSAAVERGAGQCAQWGGGRAYVEASTDKRVRDSSVQHYHFIAICGHVSVYVRRNHSAINLFSDEPRDA